MTSQSCLPESSFVIGGEDVAVVEEAQEEEGAAFLPLGHALNLLHVTFTALDVGASLNRFYVFVNLDLVTLCQYLVFKIKKILQKFDNF